MSTHTPPSPLPARQGLPSPLHLSTAARAEDLPDEQRLALESLLTGHSQRDAAAHAGVSERTLRRWLRDPVFHAALHQARCENWTETTSALQHLNRKALDALGRVLDCVDRPHAQVSAARTILLLTMKALDLEALCGRAAQVEADLDAHLRRQQHPPTSEDPGTDPHSGSDGGDPGERLSNLPPASPQPATDVGRTLDPVAPCVSPEAARPPVTHRPSAPDPEAATSAPTVPVADAGRQWAIGMGAGNDAAARRDPRPPKGRRWAGTVGDEVAVAAPLATDACLPTTENPAKSGQNRTSAIFQMFSRPFRAFASQRATRPRAHRRSVPPAQIRRGRAEPLSGPSWVR